MTITGRLAIFFTVLWCMVSAAMAASNEKDVLYRSDSKEYSIEGLTDKQRSEIKNIRIERRQMFVFHQETMTELYVKLHDAITAEFQNEEAVRIIIHDLLREQSAFECRMRSLEEYMERILTPMQFGRYLLLQYANPPAENSDPD